MAPDRSLVATFLQRLDPSATCFSFRTFSDTPYTRQAGYDPLERALHAPLNDCWEELVALNRQGAAVSVTINQTNCQGRAVSDITRVRALFLDMDHASSPDLFPVLPHLQVATSPQHNHYYWFLSDMTLSEFLFVQRRLAQTYDGDDRACALNQAMQLPGFWRRKMSTRPSLARLTLLTNARNYSLAQLRPLLHESNER
jgi:hypothetical protein